MSMRQIAVTIRVVLAFAAALWACVGLLPSLVDLPTVQRIDARIALGLDLSGGARLQYTLLDMPAESADELRDRTVEALRERLAALDRDDVSVRGTDRTVTIEMGGIDAEDLEVVRRLIASDVQLELCRVDDSAGLFAGLTELPAAVERRSEDFPTASRRAHVAHYLVGLGPDGESRLGEVLRSVRAPADRRIVLGPVPAHQASRSDDPSEPPWRTYVLYRQCDLTGDHIGKARAVIDDQGRHAVALVFDPEGKRIFTALTRAARGQRIAIVLDGVVVSAPLVREAITGGRAQIDLAPSAAPAEAAREAEQLAAALRSGALPARLELESEDVIHPAYSGLEIRVAMSLWGLALIAFAVAVVKRGGRAGGPVGASPLVCLLLSFGALAWLNATLTAMSLVAMVAMCLLCAASGLIMFETVQRRLRRGLDEDAARRRGWMMALFAALPMHLVALGAAAAVYAVGHGPWRGLGVGLLISGLASAVATALVSSLAISLSRRALP